MSDIASAFRDHLRTESTVTQYVGQRVRTRWARSSSFRDSSGKVQPYIIVLSISGDALHHQGGAMNRRNPRVEAHCFARTATAVNKTSNAVIGVMDGLTKTYMGRQNLFIRSIVLAVVPREVDEPPQDGSEDPVFRDLLEFDVWHEQDVPVFA